jgi:hypothetical protein
MRGVAERRQGDTLCADAQPLTPPVPSVAHVRCSGCETPLVILPASVAILVRADHETLREILAQLEDANGDKYTLAEADGSFACPACTMPGYAASVSDPSLTW